MVGDHDRGRADIDRAARIRHRHHALQAELPAPIGADLLGHFPVHRLIEHLVEIVRDRQRDVGPFGDVPAQVGQVERLAEQIIERPFGMRGEAHRRSRRQLRRRGEAGAQAALAIARDDRVDRQRDRIELGVLAHVDQRPVQPLVLVDVELEHLGGADGTPDLLDADRTQAGDAEIGAVFLRHPRHRALALPVEQPLQRGRRQEQRHRQFAPHDGGAHVDSLDASEHVGDEIAIGKGFGVAHLGRFVVGGAVDIMEDRIRQPGLGEPAEILDIVAIGQAHDGPVSGRRPPPPRFPIASGPKAVLLIRP